MPGLPTFADFLTATKAHKITTAKEILNEAVKQTYLLAEALRGMDSAKIVRGGSKIIDDIQLSDAGTFEFYSPNAEFSPTDTDTLKQIEVGWRFAKTHYAFNDETITLNEGNPEDIYVDLKRKYQQTAATDMMNGMENALWATPVATTMESGSGENPPAFSLPTFVNEQTYGLPSGFTTIMAVNPTSESRWRPQQVSYDAANPSAETNGLLAGFDDMFLDVRFESPDSASAYFENDRLRKMKILTNKDGHKLYKRTLRAGNDHFISPQDPAYNNPTYAGIPVKYIQATDAALLDLTNGTAWASGRPRFMWLNFEYLFPIYHTKGYMEQVGPKDGGIGQPFSHAVFFRNWYNWFCRSRQRQGIVYPA